jgi:transposase-like protein
MKEDTAMADSIVAPKELLSKLAAGGEFGFFREALFSVLRELIEIEVTAKTGAPLGEHTSERLCQRNGYRERRLDTRWARFCF